MKKIGYKKILILLGIAFFSCQGEEFEPLKNEIAVTSNSLIKGEYKYGDTGGRCSIYGVSLSSDKQRTGFYGTYGYSAQAKGTIGELSNDGALLWLQTLDIVDYNSRYIATADGGYFFYGNRKISDEQYGAFLYFLSSANQTAIEISVPKPDNNVIQGIYHVENLGNGQYLFYLATGDKYYFATFAFSGSELSLVSSWVATNYWVAIADIAPVADAYEITGILTSNGKIYARKLVLTSTSVNLIWNTEIDGSNNDDMSAWKAGTTVSNGKVYVSYLNGQSWSEESATDSNTHIVCLESNTGNVIWKTTAKMTGNEEHGRYYSIYPYNLFCQNNKLYLAGKQVDFSYTNSHSTRGYGGIQTFDLNGNFLKLHLFGSDVMQSGVNDATINGSQLYCFGYTDERYTSKTTFDDWFIPYDGFRGWFFKVNIGDL